MFWTPYRPTIPIFANCDPWTCNILDNTREKWKWEHWKKRHVAVNIEILAKELGENRHTNTYRWEIKQREREIKRMMQILQDFTRILHSCIAHLRTDLLDFVHNNAHILPEKKGSQWVREREESKVRERMCGKSEAKQQGYWYRLRLRVYSGIE